MNSWLLRHVGFDPDAPLLSRFLGIESPVDPPDFFDQLISGEMALHRERRADEKEPIHR